MNVYHVTRLCAYFSLRGFIMFYEDDPKLPSGNQNLSNSGIFLPTHSHQSRFGSPLMWSLNTGLLNKVWNCWTLVKPPEIVTQRHTSMFQGFKVRPTIQLAVRKWKVLHTACLYLSQIRLRYATGVNGTADRIQSEGPGPNSKASHVLVMSLDYYAGAVSTPA